MSIFQIIQHKIKVCISILNKGIKLVIGGIIFIPILIVSPFLKLRVGELESRLIGHFSLTIELYLSDLKNDVIKNKGNTLDIFFFNKAISNRFLADKWSKLFRIYPSFPWAQLHFFLIQTGIANSYLVPMRHWKISKNWQIDTYHSLDRVSAHIEFTNEEKIESENVLYKLGITSGNPIVCFHIRDSLFHQNPIYNLNRRGPRDNQISIFEKSMKGLAGNNINVVRVGRKMSQPLKSSDRIIDYSFSYLQDDMIDIYLMHKSYFIVGTLSGLENVGLMFRRPLCAVNVSEWRTLDNFNFSQIPIFLPKKFIWKNSMIPLTLSEIITTGVYEFNWNKEFEKSGILYVDNTEDDIADTVNQMFMYIKSKDEYLELSLKDKLINDFLHALPKRNGRKILARLPLNFLQKNPHLLK
jgi:putative glycosyltransferase (TIGR04372 family)